MSIDVRRDPRFDIIIASMHANSAIMTPQEVLANALADAYIVGIEDGKQERNELRAQLDHITKRIDDIHALVPTFAQYVRVLEDAIKEALDPKNHHRMYAILQQTLAAKEDRG